MILSENLPRTSTMHVKCLTKNVLFAHGIGKTFKNGEIFEEFSSKSNYACKIFDKKKSSYLLILMGKHLKYAS